MLTQFHMVTLILLLQPCPTFLVTRSHYVQSLLNFSTYISFERGLHIPFLSDSSPTSQLTEILQGCSSDFSVRVTGFLDFVHHPEFWTLSIIQNSGQWPKDSDDYVWLIGFWTSSIICNSKYLEFQMMDKVQIPNNSECYTPSSKPFRFWFLSDRSTSDSIIYLRVHP
jgi:hypothetical protein